MTIRQEQVKDHKQVEELARDAFWDIYRPGCYEHLVVHRLREYGCFIKELDFVMEDLDEVALSNSISTNDDVQVLQVDTGILEGIEPFYAYPFNMTIHHNSKLLFS